MFVSILQQGDFLIASIHAALNDAESVRFQEDLVEQVGARRAKGVIIDIAALDVLDSFGSKSLRDLAHMARLRGAEMVVVGIQPDVAFAIVKLGMDVDIHTALDLEEGLTYLEDVTAGNRTGGSTLGGSDRPRRGARQTDERHRRRDYTPSCEERECSLCPRTGGPMPPPAARSV